MKIFVKNMVNIRCKILLKEYLEKLGIEYESIEIGEIFVSKPLDPDLRLELKNTIAESGFEIIDDHKTILIERIKQVVFKMIFEGDELPAENFSWYISNALSLNYTYLANLFSDIQGITLEHYIITLKIEKAKEMLLSGDLTLTEIAYLLHYSSVAHLSNQFKKVTGLTATAYKNLKKHRVD